MTKKTRTRRRAVSATAVAAATVVALGACSGGDDATASSDGEQEIRLSLDWSTYVPYHAPFAVAMENGIYEEYGLEVTESLPGGSGDAVLQVGSGKSDVAWADLSTAAASMLQDLPITAVAKVQEKNASGLTVLQETELDDAQDVVGLRIGSTPGGSDSTLIGAFLNANDISESDVDIVNLPANGKFPALLTGDVDAISGQVYFYVSGAQAEGREAHGLSYSELGLEVLDHGFVASDSFIESDPDAISDFLSAYRDGLAETIEDPAAACEILVGKSNGAVVQDQCEIQLDLWLPLVTPTDAEEWGTNSVEEWENTVRVLKEYGEATGEREPESMFTNDLVPSE